jgi:hypothetical protein
MDDPVKIIWKYKNKNRRIQYNQYIFVGPVESDIMKILNKISDISLYDTLVTLNKTELKAIETKYGDYWYRKFFNSFHTSNIIATIKETNAQKQEILDKYGKVWFDKHIETQELIEKKLLYSYETLVKDERTRKTVKKGRAAAIVDDDTELNYKTQADEEVEKLFNIKVKNRSTEEVVNNSTQTNSEVEQNTKRLFNIKDTDETLLDKDLETAKQQISDQEYDEENDLEENEDADLEDDLEDDLEQDGGNIITSSFNRLVGGADDEEIDDDLDDVDNDIDNANEETEEGQSNNEDNAQKATPEDNFEEGLEGSELLTDEEMDMAEIEQMYKEVDVNPDEHLSQTTTLIKKALNDENLFDKKLKSMIEFDVSKDNNIYDENLRDVYKKSYITLYYIHRDDTIKTIKDKICASIKNNIEFDSHPYLAPSRQYLWSQYTYNNKLDKVMVGQKWIRRNELLSIDIEPNNNIRIYEELRGNLKLLRDNIRRYGNKIKYENDETNILYDYTNYVTDNELYMIDVYNEFGRGYKPDQETIKNLSDIYLKIYFPKIRGDDLKYILDYLNGETKVESSKSVTIYETITNDLIMENEIMFMVENIKNETNYKKIFKDNYITQSVIHVNLRLKSGKIDLFRIFDKFEPTAQYPFIQYQTPDGQIAFKFKKNEISDYLKVKENADVLSKWFENAPYGISFKVKIKEKEVDKFMAINLNETGRIEYKTQWKEEDMATINDIKKTYNYVRELIGKLNTEENKLKIDPPDDTEFKYAFINTIQKFELPDNYGINHNDLSEFSRYFYPYVALVIEPRKRQAKVHKADEKSKFGTYLRYKRVSKYENQSRLEQRIMYFMRNYEYSDATLSNEISKQFNITEERAMEEIDKVRSRYTHLKRSRKILKKLENIPKYKPPGIGIDIQGKQREKYKIRISGARDKQQLDRIITFMNILIHLYVETYLLKIPERQILKEKLKKLNNIARRRSKVDDIVNYSKDIKTVKQMTQMDKRRIGFKPEKGQNQWTRSCQNSGNDKKRRPQQYNMSNMGELIKKGYTLNKKTGVFEKKTILKGKGSKKKEIVVRTVTLQDYDEEGNPTGNEIHYACSPEENGDHMYVGFLTRSSNPFGYCMPCCFKKDPMISKNKEKREFFARCLGKSDNDSIKTSQKAMGDKLYILQDTNKIQDGRFGFLPKYLDFFFNYALDKQKKIKHHYLVRTETGYFFKYGTKQDEHQFLNAVATVLDVTTNDIKEKLIKTLENDKSDTLFTSLNNGDIKTQFTVRENYIEYIKYNNFLDFDVVNNLMSIPGVLSSGGFNIIVFQKKLTLISKMLEKEKVKEDFTLLCQNLEDQHTITDKNKQNIFMLKENKNYYPIVMVLKDNENDKSLSIQKTFKYDESEKNNIVSHIKPFYEKNCHGSFLDDIIYKNYSLTAKMTYSILTDLKDKNFSPKFQVIDIRNKCKYIITTNNTLVPVRPSGSLYNLQIVKSIDKYIDDFDKTIDKLKELYKKTNKQLPIDPIGVYYDEKKKSNIRSIALMTKTHDIIPIQPIDLNINKLQEMNYIYENKPLYDKIDKEILKGKNNMVIDKRITDVVSDKYYDESYELFRFEFSYFINKEENTYIKRKLELLMTDTKLKKQSRVLKIRLILYRIIDKDLYRIYKTIIDEQLNKGYDEEFTQDGGGRKLITIISKLPELDNYQVNNTRETCDIHVNKDQCNNNVHCRWAHDDCRMALTRDMIVVFVNKLSEEIASNDLKAFELLQIGNYFVSDIVDYNKFKEHAGQQIVRSSSNTIKKVLNELFGKDNIPKIGKRRGVKLIDINYQQMNLQYSLRENDGIYAQQIIDNNLSIFRGYVNCYYWIKNNFYDLQTRNLGYYSQVQTDLAHYFRSLIIDWLQDTKNYNIVKTDLFQYMDMKQTETDDNMINEFIVKISADVFTITNCIVELFILNKLQKIPIIVYNDDNQIIYVFNNGIEYHYRKHKEIPNSVNKLLTNKENTIMLRFGFYRHASIPDEIESLTVV